MQFEWDEAKARSNLAKHGISFDVARRVWDDPLNDIFFDRFENGERRYHCIGLVGPATFLVVHSYPDDDESHVRIISARRADRRERARYERALHRG